MRKEQAEILYEYIKKFNFNKSDLTRMDKICFSQWYHDNFGDEDIVNFLCEIYDMNISKVKREIIADFIINQKNRLIRSAYKSYFIQRVKSVSKENLNHFFAGRRLPYNWLSEYDISESFKPGSVRMAYRLSNGERFEIDKNVAKTVKDIIIDNELFPSLITVESGFKTFGENGNLDTYIKDIKDQIKSNQKVLTK